MKKETSENIALVFFTIVLPAIYLLKSYVGLKLG